MRHPIRTRLYAAFALAGAILSSSVSSRAWCAETSTGFMAAYHSITSDEAKRHVEVLANDTFEGREAGSRGGHAAGRYLVDFLVKARLQPAGDGNGFFQAFGPQHRNILGVIPGADENLKNEVVIIGAHYDHVGYGTPRNSYGPWGHIHNGADDNGSGAAGLLEVIDAFSRLPQPPKRTVLFALWDAEEKGLLGSQHWVEHPTLPLANVHISLNMDMIGRLRDDRVEVFGTRTAHGLRQFISQQNADSGLRLDYLWDMKPDSDHYTFFQKKLPSVMLHTGLHNDYHRPSDDVEKVSFPGIERVARLAFVLTHAFANESGSREFRAASKQETAATRDAFEKVPGPAPVRLGVEWDHSEAARSIVITKVRPRTPAQRADLRPGDRVTHVDGQFLDNPLDLAELLLIADREVVLTIARPGEEAPLTKTIELLGSASRWGVSWREDESEPGAVVVVRILPGSPADKGGLKLGDRVEQIQGRDIRPGEDLVDLMAQAPSTIELLIEREGIERRVTLKSLKRMR